MQRVEHGEIGFARHAKGVLDALRDKLIDEDLAACAGGEGHGSILAADSEPPARRTKTALPQRKARQRTNESER